MVKRRWNEVQSERVVTIQSLRVHPFEHAAVLVKFSGNHGTATIGSECLATPADFARLCSDWFPGATVDLPHNEAAWAGWLRWKFGHAIPKPEVETPKPEQPEPVADYAI
jgi:hypothetical protein